MQRKTDMRPTMSTFWINEDRAGTVTIGSLTETFAR